MHKKKGPHRIVKLSLILLILGFILYPTQAKKISLNSDFFQFSQNKKQITASSNVRLEIDDILIEAEKVHLNTETKKAWGKGNIRIQRNDKIVHTKSFLFDLDRNIVSLGKTRISVKPSEKENPIFLSANEITDYPNKKIGKNGILTSCDRIHPHYHISAETFHYEPDKRIIGQNVHLHFPLMGLNLPIPFLTWWWTPLYNFELGKRRIIWNFPTIGRKNTQGWGWFVQNRIDYDYLNGKESSILIDWFENKGIGLGIEHQYKAFGDYGQIKAYYLQDPLRQDAHRSYGLSQNFKFSDKWQLNANYERVKAEKINASVFQNDENTHLQLIYDNLGDRYDTEWHDLHNYRQNFRNTQFNFKHTFNKETPYNIQFRQRDNQKLKKRTQDTTFTHKHQLSETQIIDTQVYYGAIESLEKSTPVDQSLTLKTVYKQSITDALKLTLTMDHFIDPEGDRVTSDETSQLNNFFFKEPELKLDYSQPDLFGFNFKQNIIIARYQELQYDRNRATFNVFPAKEDYDLLPNTYRFTTQANQTWNNLWNKGSLSVQTHYDQYIFKTVGKSLFEGDAFYKLKFSINYTTELTSFLNTSTKFNQNYVNENGYIPFLTTIAPDRVNRRILEQNLTFFINSPQKYAWTHNLIYDFENEKWNQYNTRITIKPDETFKLTAETSIDINRLNTYLDNRHKEDFQTQGIFQPLILNWEYSPQNNFKIEGSYLRDVNKGLIRNSNIAFNFNIGNSPHNQWQIQTLFDYNTQSDLRNFTPTHYELQTYSIIKTEHCRRYKISYNKRQDEFRFEVIILAFPETPISIEKSRDVWRVKGFLDKGVKERF